MASNKTSTGRKSSLVVLFVAVFLIVAITVAGVCVHFLVEGDVGKIVLVALIGLLVAVGAVSFAVLEGMRRADRRRTQVLARNGERRNLYYPAAPEMSNQTSWAYSTPWRQEGGGT